MVNVKNSILKNVDSPARYVGGEFNQIIKNKYMVKCRYALCYPDLYETAMSDITVKRMYNKFNNMKNVWCERYFAPWPDFEIELRKNELTAYTLESKEALKEFDILHFIVKDELNYTNVINMINLTAMPIDADKRNELHPFIVISGNAILNPMPLAKFADFYILSNDDKVYEYIIEKYLMWKETKELKKCFLEQIKDVEGIYIPTIHTNDTQIKFVAKSDTNDDVVIENSIVQSMEIKEDSILIEISNGCKNNNRLYNDSYILEKYTQKSIEEIVSKVSKAMKNTGINDICIIATDINNYSNINDLINSLLKINDRINIKCNQVDVSKIDKEALKKLPELRKNAVIIDVIAGTKRLRNVLNLKVDEKTILDSVRYAFNNGLTYIKLKYIIGLPTETYEDLDGIRDFTERVIEIYNEISKDKKKGKCNVNVNIEIFSPKLFTPFQWCGQDTVSQLEKKQQYLKDIFVSKNIACDFEDVNLAMIKTVLARGDEKISNVIYSAWRNGARFDSSNQCFNFSCWQKAFEKNDIDYRSYANMEYDLNKKLPWDNILVNSPKDKLKQEYKILKETNEKV